MPRAVALGQLYLLLLLRQNLCEVLRHSYLLVYLPNKTQRLYFQAMTKMVHDGHLGRSDKPAQQDALK